jgi:uncharacterized protein YgbK (DUF1537 family)
VGTVPGVRFGAIADDLTGACDAGVQFAARGIPTLVWLAPEAPEGPELVVLVSRGRSLAPEEARRAAAARCAELIRAERPLVFQKIDSTFRGNPDFELAAAMEVCGHRLAVLSPAFPAMGRTVEGGWLRVRGRQEAIHLPTRLRREGLFDVVEIPRDRFEALLELRTRKPSVAVADAICDEDLARLAGIVFAREPPPLAVGSAGLAGAIAARLARALGRTVPPPVPHRSPSGSVLFVLGSTHPVTLAQTRYLAEAGVEVAPISEPARLRRALAAGSHAALLIDVARTSAAELALISELLAAGGVRGLVVTGGDAAAVVLGALSAQGVRLASEIRTGIPYGRLAGGPLNGLPVATKAGGFGEPDALLACAHYLSGLAPVE